MIIPTLLEFDFIPVGNGGYYGYKGEGFELCLENCLNGYDVALYDDNQELLYPKVCTNLSGVFSSLRAFEAALPIYVKLLRQYEQDQKNRQNQAGGIL